MLTHLPSVFINGIRTVTATLFLFTNYLHYKSMKKNNFSLIHSKGQKQKILRIMKLCTIFVCVFQLSLTATTFSQQKKVNFNLKNVSMESLFREIQKQTGYYFVFNYEDLGKITLPKVQAREQEVGQLLHQILEKSGYTYSFENNIIVITPNKEQSNQEQPQKRTLRGKVTDIQKQPLPGVSIAIKGTNLGVSTDSDGNYQLDLPNMKNLTLIYRFIGMKTIEVIFVGQTEINIVLEEEVKEMEEVVITGIFKKSRESYTGAVTTISSKELQQVGNRNILTSIRNIDPSFNITENINIGSDPNVLPDITIRGGSSLDVDLDDLQNNSQNQSQQNQPLFIMDGFEISLQRMMDMDENQIESITLLKDASATAMYGARGANGVVVITSKQPEAGKLNITYRGGINIEIPDLTSYDLLNAEEKIAYEIAADIYSHPDARIEQTRLDLLNRRRLEVARGVDTYWLKYPVRTGVGSRHSLRFEGGDKTIRYVASIGYNNITGVMKGSGRKTLTTNMFLSYRLKTFTFKNDFNFSSNKAENSPYENFYSYTQQNPYWKPYDDEGKIKKVLEDEIIDGQHFYKLNPLYNATLPYKNESGYKSIQNNLAIEWELLKGLSLRGRLGIHWQQGREDVYLSANHTSFDSYSGADFSRKGSYTYKTDYSFRYEGDFTLNFACTFNEKHAIYAGLNYNFSESKGENYSIKAEGYSGLNMDFLPLGAFYAKNGTPNGSESIARRIGAILNLNYTYDKRYYIDVSAKAEGSSKFGSNKRTAPFWSSGIGWNIHNESWSKESSWLNVMRLRASYGISGSQNFNPYQALTSLTYYGSEKYKHWVGSYMLGLGNPDLAWQQVKQFNTGLEIQVFNSRLRINLDLYNNMTDNLLSDITLPASSGFGAYKANVGKVRNRGIEAGFNAYLIRKTANRLIWSIGGTLVHNQNKIMKISNSLDFLNEKLNNEAKANPSFLFKEGESMKTIYVVRSMGIDPSNGKEIFMKTDGSKTYTWDAKDKVACGLNEPKVMGNFNTMIRWKNISLNAIFSYRLGGQLYNQTLIDRVENVDPWMNTDRRVFYARWKQAGDKTYLKSVKDLTNTKASSRFVMDENTFECRSVNISYDLNSKWLQQQIGLDFFSVTAYAEDVFYISTVKRERGLNYPFSRKFSLSLTARF